MLVYKVIHWNGERGIAESELGKLQFTIADIMPSDIVGIRENIAIVVVDGIIEIASSSFSRWEQTNHDEFISLHSEITVVKIGRAHV